MASLGVLAILLISLLSQNILENASRRVENVFNDAKKVQEIQQNLLLPLFELRESTLSLIITPDGSYKQHLLSTLTPMVKSLDHAFSLLEDASLVSLWDKYKKMIFIEDGYKNYRRLVYLHDGYQTGITEGEETSPAIRQERVLFYTLVSKLKTVQDRQLKQSYQTFKNAEESFSKKQVFIVGAIILILASTLLFGFLIARNIVLSMERVQKGLKRFFDLLGRKIDKNHPIKIPLKSTDEFGEIATLINTNAEILREKLKKDIALIEDATNVMCALKKGDLDSRLVETASSSELNRLKEVINTMLDSLEERIVQEIEERSKQEQLLIQQSKLASMGNMIGNIAHQWRQPLSEINAILMNMQIRKAHDDLSDIVFDDSIEECNVILKHMSQTISDFQNFFKPSKEKTRFSLEEECRNAYYIIESSLKYNNITLHMDIEKECYVVGYPREFSQAILNIFSNAKDVLLERRIKEPLIEMTVKVGKKFVLVKVEDNAGGIEEGIVERIFEPYFTTKHASQGTGIGLYMCKIIIEDSMHGFIEVKNGSKGAVFTIKLQREP